MSKRKKSGKEIGSSATGFGLTALGLVLLFRPASLLAVAIIAGVAYGVGKLVGVMSSGFDPTTHNKQDEPKERKFDQLNSQTGDDNADQVIVKGKEMLDRIRHANDGIPDPRLTIQLNRIEDKCVSIFETVAERPEKAPQIRKFMNYYLPTTLKLVESYKTMQDRGISEHQMANARTTLYSAMDKITTACQKQLDNLYKDTMLDVSTDIDVLEQMLRRDGFIDGELSEEGVDRNARTAASAQMGDELVPTLNVSSDKETASSEYTHGYFREKAHS